MKMMPDYRISTIYEITPEFVLKNQIQLLFVDIDNTLAAYNQQVPSPQVKEWVNQMKRFCHLIFISNNKHERVACFCEGLGEYVSFACKPFGFKAYHKAKVYGIPSSYVACVGDQLLTDVMGARFHGFRAILCEPITSKDIIYTKIPRMIERKILNRWEKKNEKM